MKSWQVTLFVLDYSIAIDDQTLKLQENSVLTWTNPLVGENSGGVSVWTLTLTESLY